MKLTNLPKEVIADLNDRDRWRLDVDYGFDAKHEFFQSWNRFKKLGAIPLGHQASRLG